MSFSLSTPLTDPASVWDHGDLCVVRAVGARWKSERSTRTNFIFFFFLYLLCKCRVRGDRLTSAQVEASCNSCPLHLASHKMKPGGKATAIYGEAVCRERHRGLSSSTPTPSQPQQLRARILRGHLGSPSSLDSLGYLYWTEDYKSLISWLFRFHL